MQLQRFGNLFPDTHHGLRLVAVPKNHRQSLPTDLAHAFLLRLLRALSSAQRLQQDFPDWILARR
jgi:hypothetical protein